MDEIIKFFTSVPLWELALIFFARIIEVSMGTLRIILINKGYRKVGVILAFCEVMLWVFVASRVIAGITERPLKGIVYSLGFASGVYVGSRLESLIAFGKVLVQAITTPENGKAIADVLRNQGLGVTTLEGQGKDSSRLVIMVYTNRKGKEKIIQQIKEIDEKAMIVSNDVTTLEGGYIGNWRRFVK
ncbi:MAG: DUF5698 domain-containing protein [Bacilli bacterium]|jgi:uncharacterized protein YebE (UPF0316 family)|nr:DUF5698 domain-containing protein [Bacilli bacterium]